MKNLTNMLDRSNLTPRERYILLIQNDVEKEKNGKEILTPGDKAALENWKAKEDWEAKEWNRMNEGWKHVGRMEIEVEFYYKDAHTSYLAQLPILTEMLHYPADREMKRYIENLENLKKVTIEEAIEIAAKQREIKLRDGVDFDYAVYQLAFERLSEEEKEQFRDLYVEIEYDHQYMDQEEVIANLFNSKDELDQDAKEKLADLVAEKSYNKFAHEYQLFHYFACIPLVEVARYFLKSKNVEVPGKQMSKDQGADKEQSSTTDQVTKLMEKYSAEHGISIKVMLKEACLKWLDNGLLDEYTPLVLSNQSHLLEQWLSAKKRAKKILLGHVKKGELALRERNEKETRKDKLYSKNLYDAELENAKKVLEDAGLEIPFKGEVDERVAFETFDNVVITGESLYDLKADYEFVKKFKERADKYESNLGIVYTNDDSENGEQLDRELLVCERDKDGKANFFSPYGLSITLLSRIHDGKSMFKELEEDGKKIIKFKSNEFYRLFKERRQSLVDNYATLLAFENLFKRLAKVYETDFTYHVAQRIQFLRGCIDLYNESILVATNAAKEDLKRTRHGIFKQRETLHFEDELIIDMESMVPKTESLKDHEIKLREILGEF